MQNALQHRPTMTRRLTSKEAAKIGAKGGKTCGKSKARDPEKMRAAALKRWNTPISKLAAIINKRDKDKIL